MDPIHDYCFSQFRGYYLPCDLCEHKNLVEQCIVAANANPDCHMSFIMCLKISMWVGDIKERSLPFGQSILLNPVKISL
jgi:hypothetical protein